MHTYISRFSYQCLFHPSVVKLLYCQVCGIHDKTSMVSSISLFTSLCFIAICLAHPATHFVNDSYVNSQTLQDPYPYDFPVLQNGSLVDDGLFPMPLCHGFKLEEASIDQLQQALSNGTLTSVKLALCFLKRIYQIDGYIR